MARIESLGILNTDSGKEYLAELYGKVIQNVQKALVSAGMKTPTCPATRPLAL